MEIRLTPEQEAAILQIAQHEGKSVDQLIFDATVNSYEGDRRFREALRRGIAQADAGNSIEEEMDARFNKMLGG